MYEREKNKIETSEYNAYLSNYTIKICDHVKNVGMFNIHANFNGKFVGEAKKIYKKSD